MSLRKVFLLAAILSGLFGFYGDQEVYAAKERQPVSKSSDLRFWDYGDGTILDSKTDLMWMKKDYWQLEGEHLNWYRAKEFLQKVNHKKYFGYSDWRLPEPEEAITLYERRKQNSDKDGDRFFIDRIFPKGAGWSTWTNKEKGQKAIIISYKDEGLSEFQDKINGPDAFLRLVRGPKK
jgi:hypothetical protein